MPASAPALLSPLPATPVPELYRQMWAHAAGARARLAAALAMMGGSQVLKLALPWLAAQAIDALQAGGRAGLRPAALWVGAILGLQAVVWLLHGPARVLERGVALRVRRSVADELYHRLSNAPLAWHDRHHSGDLQHRAAQASTALYGFTQSQFLYLQNVIHLAGPLVALWWLSAWTGGLAAAGFVTIGLIVLRFDRTLLRLAERENHAERHYAAGLLDFVGNISAVASLRLQAASRTLLDTRLVAVFQPLSRSIVVTEWKWCAVDLLTIGLGWALVALHAGTVVAGGGVLLIGSLYMVHSYAQQAAGVLCSMAANFQGLVQTQADHASAEPIRRAPVAPVCPTPLPEGWTTLALHGIGYAHAGGGSARGGVHELDLVLRRGERLALVGPSGSGKSTLLRVLAGLYQAQQGHVSVDGVPQLLRRHAGEQATLIPQEAEIFEATVRDNIAFGRPVAPADLQRAVYASALDEVLAGLPLGLDTPMTERGCNLSGGQRQRLALARGVLAAQGSALVLLDEPTSALDPLIEQHVHQRLLQALGPACVVAAVHRPALLPHFDRVALMVAGRIVDVGTADELRTRQPLFAALQRGHLPQAAQGAGQELGLPR